MKYFKTVVRVQPTACVVVVMRRDKSFLLPRCTSQIKACHDQVFIHTLDDDNMYFNIKDILRTVWNPMSTAGDERGDTVRSTLFDDVFFCAGCDMVSSTECRSSFHECTIPAFERYIICGTRSIHDHSVHYGPYTHMTLKLHRPWVSTRQIICSLVTKARHWSSVRDQCGR